MNEVEAVARAIDAASKNARLGQEWEWFIPEAQAAIAALDAARGDVVARIADWLTKQPPHLSLQEYAQAIEAREWEQSND